MDQWNRAYFLPVARHGQTGEMSAAVPQSIIDVLRAFQLPGDVYSGNVQRNVPMFEPQGDELDALQAENPEYIKRLSDLAGSLTLGSGAIPAEKGALRAGASMRKAGSAVDDLIDREPPVKKGIRAYHGSPHDFDEFDLSKIGTGEGAQDLGQGFYFYDNAGAAEMYRNPAARWGDLEAMRRYKKMGPGRVYEVDIAAVPNEILDIDAPASTLAKNSKLAARRDAKIASETDGDFARTMREHMKIRHIIDGAEQDAAADGYKGFKRKKWGGETEMVIFDDKLISIVRKYGIAALVSAGVISQADGEALAAEGYPE